VQKHGWWLRATILGMALLTTTGGLATAQTPDDSVLEGRLLQAPDGALYLYQAGVRWRVLPVAVTDSQLAGIPNSGITVERLDRLPAATPIIQLAPTATIPPTSAPTP
jgi:hypothetical protein